MIPNNIKNDIFRAYEEENLQMLADFYRVLLLLPIVNQMLEENGKETIQVTSDIELVSEVLAYIESEYGVVANISNENFSDEENVEYVQNILELLKTFSENL